jgi:outer membrane lipoprotein-sorting protein
LTKPICIAAILLMAWASSMAQSYDEALAKMRDTEHAIRTYRCTFVSFARGPERIDNTTFKYYFKNPGWVRMEALTGKIEGTVLLYTGGDVRVKPGHGVFSFFSYSFSPAHKWVCDARGNGLPQSSWGYYIDQHMLMKPLTRSKFMGFDTVGAKRALRYELASTDPAQTRSIAAEQLWIDAQTFLLLQYRQFDSNGTLIQSGLYQDCVLDSDLPDSLFTEFSKD